MEPVIVIVAIVVLSIAGVVAGRSWAGGDPQRDLRLSRGAYATSAVFVFSWLAGMILNFPLLSNVAIVGAIAAGAVAADAGQRLVKKR